MAAPETDQNAAVGDALHERVRHLESATDRTWTKVEILERKSSLGGLKRTLTVLAASLISGAVSAAVTILVFARLQDNPENSRAYLNRIPPNSEILIITNILQTSGTLVNYTGRLQSAGSDYVVISTANQKKLMIRLEHILYIDHK